MRRSLVLAFVLLLALAGAGRASAGGFTRTDAFFAADDGVQLAYSYYEPTDARPAAGFPAVMVFHGLGGKRETVQSVIEAFASNGYAVLAADARAHGASGGLFSLDGAREMADLAAMYEQLLASRPGIDRAHIGAWGISLGGGAIWRAASEGVPFAALEPVITWTDLYGALVPQNLVKTGAVFQFSQSVAGKIDPSLAPFLPDLLSNRNLAAIKQQFDARSTRPGLSRLRIPVFMLQGRTDYAFDIDQAAAAFRLLPGPKRLYVGDLGHAPAKNPAAEQPYYLQQCVQWFDRFLKGIPNGIDTKPPVEVATDPWTGRTASFAGLPPRTTLTLKLLGHRTMNGEGKIVRSVKLPARPLETFGAPTVKVPIQNRGFGHLVAVLSAGSTIVSEGGVDLPATAPRKRTVTIKLISTAVPIPRGARLTLTLAGASTAQNPANLLYLNTVPASARIMVGNVTVTLPLLKQRISP